MDHSRAQARRASCKVRLRREVECFGFIMKLCVMRIVYRIVMATNLEREAMAGEQIERRGGLVEPGRRMGESRSESGLQQANGAV